MIHVLRLRAAVAILLFVLAAAACGRENPVPDGPIPIAPPALIDGERLFAANCSQCHGEGARGTTRGPPLVHKVYEPSHHGDEAFHLAVARGVAPHHWRFGPMPPQPQVSREQAAQIISYIRWLQRQAGIH